MAKLKRYNLFDSLEPFVLKDVQLTDKMVGTGSYATVYEVMYDGKKCAGKEIHRVLLEQGDYSYTLRRFKEECRILSSLHHPNIVQFFGVYFKEKEKVPILVMEFLPMNLTSCIEKHGILPEERGYSILHDVALGLCYLHSQSPPIIHRDLSANNVLLTEDMLAKISDFGVAKMINLSPLQASKLTETPGTPDYMPPETMDANAKYDTSVDEFSFGILMIHLLSGEWPKPQCSQIRMEGNKMIPVSEAERRDVYLKCIGYDHPAMKLIRKCIDNNTTERPHADMILESLEALDLTRKKGKKEEKLEKDDVSSMEQDIAEVEEFTDYHNITVTTPAVEINGDNGRSVTEGKGSEDERRLNFDTSQELSSASITADTPTGVSVVQSRKSSAKDFEGSVFIPFDLREKSASLLDYGNRIKADLTGIKDKVVGLIPSPLQKSFVLPVASDDAEEQRRRTQMLEAAEDDDTVVVPRRKAKKGARKSKKPQSGSAPTLPGYLDSFSLTLSGEHQANSEQITSSNTSSLTPVQDTLRNSAPCSLTKSYIDNMTPSPDIAHLPHSNLSLPAVKDTHRRSLVSKSLYKEMESSTDSSSSSEGGNEEEDWNQLCKSLFMHSKRKKRLISMDEGKQWSDHERDSSYSPSQSPSEAQATSSGKILSPTATISIPISLPGRRNSSLLSVCLSDKLLWAVDSKCYVYFMIMESNNQTWHYSKDGKMNQISSSSSGNNVWGVFKHNAYVRLGIGINIEGSKWRNITSNTRFSGKIKQVAVDETTVWAINTDGKILFRSEVGQAYVEGSAWQVVECGSKEFAYVACCQNVVWAIDTFGRVYCRTGISLSMPIGKKWKLVKVPSMVSISITRKGIVWGVSMDNSIGFQCGASAAKPSGTGPWWEVYVESVKDSEPSQSSQIGLSLFNSPTAFVDSLSSLGLDSKLTITASSESGVVVLERGHHLHACLTSITGFHYAPASDSGSFYYMRWSNFAASGTFLWLVSADDGHLYNLSGEDSLTPVDCPVKIDALAASASHVWVLSKNCIWSGAIRDSEGDCLPFEKIELPQGIHLSHIACGTTTAWAVGSNGVPYFLYGLLSQKRRSLSWIPVDSNQKKIQTIVVSPNDWLVWACDESCNVYARTGITSKIPIGQKWELIPEKQARELCADTEKIYALTPEDELICRYGIRDTNVTGDYWRKIPGKYKHIAVGEFGDLWTMDEQGRVWKQEWTIIKAVHHARSTAEQSHRGSSGWVEV